MTDLPPIPKLGDIMKRDALVKDANPIAPTNLPPTRWDCVCIICHIDWQQKITEKKPEGRCPRCGSDRFGYLTANE